MEFAKKANVDTTTDLPVQPNSWIMNTVGGREKQPKHVNGGHRSVAAVVLSALRRSGIPRLPTFLGGENTPEVRGELFPL